MHGQSLNGAMSVVLAAHNTPGSRFSSTVPIAPSSLLSFAHFLEHYSVEGGSGGSEQPSSSSGSSSSGSSSGNYSVASAASSSSSALMLAPPTTRAQILRQRRQALGAAPYPLAGWLTEHLQVRESACRAPMKKKTFPHLQNLVLIVFLPASSLLLPVLNRISAFHPFLSNFNN